MPDETTALLEIASLLRRRVEQHDEMAKRSEEQMDRFQEQQSAAKTVAQIHDEGAVQRDEMMKRYKQRDEEARQEKIVLQDEHRQFQTGLLEELKRHNALLEGLLQHLINDK